MSGGHLVHGMGTALEAPTWPAITWAEAESVLARFPAAGRLIDLHWHSPRPFSAAALIQTDRGVHFLKRHHQRLRTPAALAEEQGFMAHLRAGGLSVPQVLAADDGAGAIALGEWTYELHRAAPGIDLYRDRQSWTPFLTLDHAHAAGAALARLHRAAQGYGAPVRGDHALIASFTILLARDPLAAAAAYIAARPALAGWLAGEKNWRQELARLFGALGDEVPDQPPLWTHNDWHPSNLLWTAEGQVASIIDFGLATRTCALHDLAPRSSVPRSTGWIWGRRRRWAMSMRRLRCWTGTGRCCLSMWTGSSACCRWSMSNLPCRKSTILPGLWVTRIKRLLRGRII